MKLSEIKDYRIDRKRIVTVVSADFHERLDQDFSLLSTSERMTAAQISSRTGRSRFISSRAFLRRAVGRMLGTGIYREDFVVGTFGKPFLPAPYYSLFFNLSHTQRVIVAAFAEGEPVGIDIEGSEREISPILQRHIFRPDEISCLSSIQDTGCALLRGWVCKEAVLKCIGSGLAGDLKKIAVDLRVSQQRSFKAYDYSKAGCSGGAFRLVCLTHLEDITGVIAMRDHQSSDDDVYYSP